MKNKMKLKMMIDLLMTLSLLLLLSYQLTSQTVHELLGTGMVVLFIAHNLLNLGWYKNLFRGRWDGVRAMKTAVNLALLVLLIAMGASGVVMSRSLFAGLPIRSGMALSRVVHLAGAYWGFLLMSLHLGLHWKMILGIAKKRLPRLPAWPLRITAIAISGYGAFCFLRAGIPSYLFLQNEFAFFDYEKNAVLVLAEQFAIMGLWVFLGHYLLVGLGKFSAKRNQVK